MRLHLAFDPTWPATDNGRIRFITVPEYEVAPDMVFEVYPIVGRTEATVDFVLLQGVPAGAEVRRLPPERKETITGWPMTLHQAGLYDDGVLRETRLLAQYSIAVDAGFVLVRATTSGRFEKYRDKVVELLGTAKVELVDERPAAISELWDMR
jgi:hypothetical protein